MSELSSYLKTLADREVSTTLRELKSRFIRGNTKKAVRRVMAICEKFRKQFVFFVVGATAEYNSDFIREIIDRGHLIGCHGYYHLRHDLIPRKEALEDIKAAMDLFMTQFDFRLEGYRAPYLGYNNQVVSILEELGFVYSSSVRYYSEGFYGFKEEIPISVDDWDCLISDNGNGRDLYRRMQCGANRTAYLLHPWRVGQAWYIDSLRQFLDVNFERVISLEDYLKGDDGVILSGDIAELSLFELFMRSVRIGV